jgi:hypothetical protein
MAVLAAGNRADILQTARWQAELLEGGRPFAEDPAAGKAVKRTRAFVAAYGERKAGEKEYISMLRGVLPDIEALEQHGNPAAFEELLRRLREEVDRGDPAPAQGAHRALLLHLQAVADAGGGG